MKTNKKFIDGIYEKFDEYSKEKKDRKQNNINRIINMAAIVIVAASLIIISADKQQTRIIENGKVQEAGISLKTVGSFENFYQIMKQSNQAEQKNAVEDLRESASADSTIGIESTNKNMTSSETNIQVENVDEADIVKIDGNYIYYVVEDKVVIVSVNEPENADKVAEISFSEEEFSPNELYIYNNKLIIIGNEYAIRTAICKTDSITTNDILIKPQKQKSAIIIYDITTKTEPKEIRRVEVDGYYLSSRMIGSNLYFASNQIIYSSDIVKNDIQNLDETNYKPEYRDTAIAEEEKCIDYDRIYCFEQMESTNYLMLVGLNVDNSEEAEIQTFLGAGQKIYCSEKNMYIATSKTKYDETYKIIESSTHILKFRLNNGKFKFEAETDVNGQINNQFSMDESGEYFRVATTTGNLWNIDENTSNNIYILNDNLEEVGKVTGFGKEERIYSVRYVGDKAYVVTFKQTDPLFVIDLSNPENPQILGKLKIPGYSTYLHPYDETHIIGFGYDTKEDGTRITTNGLKMVMFDISDLNNPKELFKVTIGNRYTNSQLTYNHKALLYSKEKNIIAFPLTSYENRKTNSRAAIYEIDLEKGFTCKGEIANITDNYKEEVERIIYVNNVYYTLSKKVIKVADMDTLKVIKEIEL